MAGRLPLAIAAAGAVLAGAAGADARLAALGPGALVAAAGEAIEAEAVVLEPVRIRANGSAAVRVRLIGAPSVAARDGGSAGAASGVSSDRSPATTEPRIGGDPGRYAGSVAAGTGLAAAARGEQAVVRVLDGRVPPGVIVGAIVRLSGRVAPLGRSDAFQRRRTRR